MVYAYVLYKMGVKGHFDKLFENKYNLLNENQCLCKGEIEIKTSMKKGSVIVKLYSF